MGRNRESRTADAARAWAALLGLLALAACGGGGGGGASGEPPASLAYEDPAPTYEAWFEAAPNPPAVGGGAPTSWSVAPPLPAGLALDPATGVIAGTPTRAAAPTDHVVVARNAHGSASATVRVAVDDASTSLAPRSGPFTDAEVRHFLARTQYGGGESVRQAVLAAGIPAYVDAMLAFEADTAAERSAEGEIADPDFPQPQELARWWLHLLTRTENPFQEVLAFFWHDHFAASSSVLDGSALRWTKAHVNLWRTQGNGNLRTLLLAAARDGLMLEWLDGVRNTRTAPNENFAREFWELFTLGVDAGYTQADVVEAARAWTGYRTRFDPVSGLSTVEFDPNRHDAGTKTVLGVTIPGQNATDDFAAVVDATLDRRPVEEFLSRRAFEAFCYASPPPAVVAELGRVLRRGGWEIAPWLATLFRSEAFFSARSRAGLVKSPVDHAVGFIRATGLHIRTSVLDGALAAAGQRPTQPPTVNGWPAGSLWLSAQGMLDRANLVNACVTDRTNQANQGVDPADLLPPGTPTSGETVDALAALLRVTLSAADRATCVSYLDTRRLSDGTVVPSPFDPTSAQHVDERVRGLLYVLAQHPTYQLR